MSPQELYITEKGDLFYMNFSGFVDINVYIGNYNYVPPEWIVQKINDKISDLLRYSFDCHFFSIICIHNQQLYRFRFGVFLYELIVGVPPFLDVNEESTVTRIDNIMYQFPNFISKTAKDIISRLLIKERKNRLGFKNIDEIISHKFLKALPNTDELSDIIKNHSFSSGDVWPSSIVIDNKPEIKYDDNLYDDSSGTSEL